MNCLITIIFYLLGMFVTFCGILLYIYFKPSEKEEYGDEYAIDTEMALIMLIFWPFTIFFTTINLIISLFKYIIGICYDKLDKVINYVGEKGESRQTKKRLSKNINESEYYGTKNSK